MLDFISYNRFTTFIERLITVQKLYSSSTYVDNSPNGLFTGPVGTILQKRGNIFSYKYPTESSFTTINYVNNSIQKLCSNPALNGGINKNVTWVKLDNSPGTKWQNRGLQSDVCVICEIAPAAPCNTPIVTYIVPTPTPYITPSSYNLGDVTIGTLRVTNLIVDSESPCPPTGVGTFGQVLVCENYLYVYDGVSWKRFEISTYY